jgi:DNA invertase Pin-like site-specific DNA recombinase
LYWDGSLLSVLVTESEERCSQRKGLSVIPRALKKRGALVVWRLDRPGSSVVRLVHLISKHQDRQISFHSISENIDTNSAGGRMKFP